jgi:Subtilase family
MADTPDPLPFPQRFARLSQGGVLIDYVPGEVLVRPEDVDEAKRALRDAGADPEDMVDLAEELGAVKLLVTPRNRVPLHAVVADVLDRTPRRVVVRLNHYVHVMPHIHVWPGCLPVGIDEGPPIEAGDGGLGRRVVVLDTGLADLPWFEGRRDRDSDDERPTMTTRTGKSDCLSPVFGHGTFIAGVIHRLAPGATILGRKLPLEHSMCPADKVATEILRLRSARPDVVNLSWGCYTLRNLGTLVLERAIDALIRSLPGVAVVAAAGNDGTDTPVFPAAHKPVTAVGANDADGRRAIVDHPEFPPPFDHWASNFGSWVDIYAPGVDVRSVFPPVSPSMPCFDDRSSDQFRRGFAVWEGTSFAAPAVAGAIARRAATAGSPVDAARRLRTELEGGTIDLTAVG